MLDALKYRNFRLFFFGQGVSLVGTWMQQTTMAWLVYQLSGKLDYMPGLMGFCGMLPAFFLTPLAGVYTDRWNRHRTILITQSLAMLQSVVLVVLAATHTLAVWHLFVLSLFLGIVNAIDMPARQTFLIELVEERRNLGNAISLNSSIFNGAQLVGPAIAGFLIKPMGAWFCFLLNAISFLAVLASLLAMRLPPPLPPKPRRRVVLELKEGLHYAYHFLPIRAILLLLATISLTAMSLNALMPVFAVKVLHGGPETQGLLTGAIGLGALIGALLLAVRNTVLGLGRLIALTTGVFGLSLLAFSWSGALWMSMGILTVGGFARMIGIAASNTILQTIVDDDKRGRVMSLYTMAMLGMAPLGCLIAGGMAHYFGATYAVAIAGVACLMGCLAFTRRLPAMRLVVRPIYRRIGILPEASAGIVAVTDWTAPAEEK